MLWTSSVKYAFLSFVLWCSVYLYYTALLNKTRTQVLCIPDLHKSLIRALIYFVFTLFRLLLNETLKIFSIRERRWSRHKFGGTKFYKAEEVRKTFLNPKIKFEVFSYIICCLDFKNISFSLILLHMKTMNGVVSWYILLLALRHLFHFIVCTSFLSNFLFFS